MSTLGMRGLGLAAVLCAVTANLAAQAPAPSLEASPNRPSVSDSANVLAPGLLQLEYGWVRTWPGAGVREDAIGGVLRFGVGRRLELRWGGDPLLRNTEPGGIRQQGFGDQWFGTQLQLSRESDRSPALAVGYAINVPTASSAKGLGSGRVDHSLAFLASKEFAGLNWDFNGVYSLVGREDSLGFDRNSTWIVAVSRPLFSERLSWTGELIGQTRLNADNPSTGATLWALTCQLSPRLYVDGAIELGLAHGAPRKRVYLGVSYALADLYNARRSR